jgi:hypothetical protein
MVAGAAARVRYCLGTGKGGPSITTAIGVLEGEVATPEEEPKRRQFEVQPGTIVRAVVFGALAIVALVYVGPSEVGSMLLKVVIGVGLSTVLFVGANKLFGFVTFLVLDGNRVLRDLDPRPWAWAVIGGAAAGAVLFALSAPREQVARMPLAVAGSPAPVSSLRSPSMTGGIRRSTGRSCWCARRSASSSVAAPGC